MKQLRITAMASLVLVLALTSFTRAQVPGTIDSSFATNGVLILEPNTIGTDVANGMEVLSDDKVLLAGSTETGFLLSDAAIYRILPDGGVDATFGVNGVSIFDCGGTQDYVQAMKVLPNGKIIIAGGVYNGAADVNFFAARLTDMGFPDPTFGDNGFTIIPNPAGDGEDVANAIAIQPDGKIILAGSWAVAGTTDGHTTLVRLNEDGSLDNSFGTGGIANVTNSGYTNDAAFDVLLLSDGSIMTTGYADVLDQRVIVEKFNSSGALDPNFGNNGIAIFNLNINGSDAAWAIKLHPNGKVMIAGRKGFGPAKTDFMIMALTSTGALDTNFGVGGVGVLNVNISEAALDFLVEPSGKMVLAGTSGGGGLGVNDYTICRFNENGTVDSTFGTNGATVSEISSFFSEANSIGMQSDGKLVVGGRAATVKNDFALVRYFSDPIIAACAAPANPVTSAITSSTAKVKWDAISEAIGYKVRYKIKGSPEWINIQSNDNDKTLQGLEAGTEYAWQVKSICGVHPIVSSDWSVKQFFTTGSLRMGDESLDQISLQVYPNPSTGNFQFSINTGENTSTTASIQIVNIFGQVVHSRNADIVGGNLKEVFNLSGQLASGTYFIKISVSDKMYSSKFILQ